MTNLTGMRKVTWGMDVDEVMAAEDGEPQFNGRTLAYNVTFFGFPALLLYMFDEQGGLTLGVYIIDHDEDASDVAAFALLKAKLTAKYGEPIEMNHVDQDVDKGSWTSAEDIAEAVGVGDARFVSVWLKGTAISLLLTGEPDTLAAKLYLCYMEDLTQGMRLLSGIGDEELL